MIARLGRANEFEQDLLVAVMKKPAAAHPYTASDLQLLSSKLLQSVVSSPSQGVFCVQKFVSFRGPQASIVRCVWSMRRAPDGYVITNKVRVDDTSEQDFRKRYTTFTERYVGFFFFFACVSLCL
jgi:hypothetical protein